MTTEVTVTTTYLEILNPDHARLAFLPDSADRLIMRSWQPTPDFYRFLYRSVGQDYYWLDRLRWSDQKLQEHFANPARSLYVLYQRGTPAGYVELDQQSPEPGTEVAYFGLIPAFHGQGLGKHLLSFGIQQAFADGASRVWVHTCSLDGPHALANYQARGFVPYRVEQHQQLLPQT